MHLRTWTRGVAGLAVALTAGAGLTACSSSAAPDPDAVSIAAVPEAAALVPDAVRESGVLRVAIPTNEPPTQFYREGTREMSGLNPEIAGLVADALDLKLEVVVSNFDSIIPGLAANRFDMTVSSMTPTEDRMKELDFVEYVDMGSAIVVPKGNPDEIDFDALCGQRVAVLLGSYQLTVLIPDLDAACEARGEKPLQIQQYQDTRQAISSLVSDRSDVVYADGPILAYAALMTPEVEVAGENDIAPVAIGMPRDSGLLEAVEAAMTAALDTPEYLDVLSHYGLESMAIAEARVNVPQ